jgi:SAM-dependent methyltransferase
MCNPFCLDFIADTMTEDEVRNKRILESGSRNVNGSARKLFALFSPAVYIGTDIAPGIDVDEICDAVDLVGKYGANSFDAVVSTETLEHVRDWKQTITNYKRLLKPGGVVWITTRSVGFPFHEYPEDHWRFSGEQMSAIFADFEVLNLNTDPLEPGIFIKARKPKKWKELDLANIEAYSIDDERKGYGQ